MTIQIRKKDLAGGMIMLAIGLVSCVYCAMSYDMGTIMRMGPGLFPASLGAILAMLGLAIILTGSRRRDISDAISFDLRALSAVLAAVTSFPLIGPLLGLIPAVVVLVFVVSFGFPHRSTLQARVLLSLGIAALASIVFVLGLRIQMPAIAWPLP